KELPTIKRLNNIIFFIRTPVVIVGCYQSDAENPASFTPMRRTKANMGPKRHGAAQSRGSAPFALGIRS
ncbi:MAG: hypothetical protein ACI97B_005062, partial [Verrucomicrobiales bacterium]